METSVRRLADHTPAALLFVGLVLAATTAACAAGGVDHDEDSASGHEAPALLLTHLDLDLAVDYDAGRVDGVATWTLRNAGDVAIREVPVQVGRLMRVRDLPAAQLHYGREDRSVPAANAEALRQALEGRRQGPRFEVFVHEGSGHDQPYPEAYERSREFLAEHMK